MVYFHDFSNWDDFARGMLGGFQGRVWWITSLGISINQPIKARWCFKDFLFLPLLGEMI